MKLELGQGRKMGVWGLMVLWRGGKEKKEEAMEAMADSFLRVLRIVYLGLYGLW